MPKYEAFENSEDDDDEPAPSPRQSPMAAPSYQSIMSPSAPSAPPTKSPIAPSQPPPSASTLDDIVPADSFVINPIETSEADAEEDAVEESTPAPKVCVVKG